MFKNWSKKLRTLLIAALVVISFTGIKEAGTPLQAAEWNSPYIEYVMDSNPKLTTRQAREIVSSSYRWAAEFNIDMKLLLAVAKTESNFYPHAISASGAYGLMQVIPLWHKDKIIKAREELGNPEIFNINTNIYLGAQVLKECIRKTGKVNTALVCYSGKTPGYYNKVLAQYDLIKKI